MDIRKIHRDNLATEFSRKHVRAGMLLGKVEAVLDVLDARNIVIPAPLRQRITHIDDLDAATELTRKAAVVRSADELSED